MPTLPVAVTQAKPTGPVRVVCRTDYAMGSLVKKIRRCGTVSQWGKSDFEARALTHEIQDVKDLGLSAGR